MLLALLFCFLIPVSAFAAETTLTTTVPSDISLKIQISGKGSVFVNGKEYKKSKEITLKRSGEILYKIVPNKNYEVKSVLYNGDDMTESLKDGTFSVAVNGDAVLKVDFVKASERHKPCHKPVIRFEPVRKLVKMSIKIIHTIISWIF